MTTENNATTPAPEEQSKPSTKVSILIEWETTTGEMNITGPIGNKPVAYGMLKMAERYVDSYMSPGQQKGIIQRIMGTNNGNSPKGFRGFKQR